MTLRHYLGIFAVVALISCIPSHADAGVLYGAQPSTGLIVTFESSSGLVSNSYVAPGSLLSGHTNIGLSIAEGGSVLIYQNSNDFGNSTTLYRLNPDTGAVLTTETGDSFSPDGLSYQSDGINDLLFYSDSFFDLHRQVGYSGDVTFFWETGGPVGGLGGDGFGREFGFFDDGLIHEYDPFVSDGVFTSTLPSPTSDIEGMAFDGINLYASTASGLVFTLNPDTGDVLDVIDAPGGALYGLGAIPKVPEPSSIASMMIVLAGEFVNRTKRRRRRFAS